MDQYKYKNVLLIDDNEIDNFITGSVILKSYFAENAVEKSSAQAGLEYLRANQDNPDLLPEVIFLDIMMPVMDGFGFLEEFEKFDDRIKTYCKVIMLSSSESFKDLNRANSNKYVMKFLNKPLSEKALDVINIKVLQD